MPCPRFIDNTRECLTEIGLIPGETRAYCASDSYSRCPFYRVIFRQGPCCKYLENCAAYKFLGSHEFEKFVTLANRYCVSGNCQDCERFQLWEARRPVPDNLAPDGTGLV